jgi:hypothetical protein
MTANTDTRMSGLNGAIVLGGTLPTPGVVVAAKTQWTFSNQRDFFDGSAFGDTNKRWFPGLRDAQGTYNGLLDMSGDLLLNAAGLGAQTLYLYGDSNAGGTSIGLYEVAHGSGFLDATVDCNLNDMIKINGQFRAAANWTIFSTHS